MHKSSTGVTVVIPAYNAADFLGLQLQALLAGSRVPDEIIVSNNGSTDGTAAVVEEYRKNNPCLSLVDSSGIQGVSHARNIGCQAAQHHKILICDADDIVSERWVEEMSAALDAHDVVGSGHQLFVYDELQGNYLPQAEVLQQPEVFPGVGYMLGASIGFRREVFEELKGFDITYIGGHDEVDFCVRAESAGFSQGWIAQALILYRQRSSQAGVAKQFRNYGRTQIQFMVKMAPRFNERIPSLPLMVKKVVKAAPQAFLKKDLPAETIQGFWWNVGRLEGLLRYTLRK